MFRHENVPCETRAPSTPLSSGRTPNRFKDPIGAICSEKQHLHRSSAVRGFDPYKQTLSGYALLPKKRPHIYFAAQQAVDQSPRSSEAAQPMTPRVIANLLASKTCRELTHLEVKLAPDGSTVAPVPTRYCSGRDGAESEHSNSS